MVQALAHAARAASRTMGADLRSQIKTLAPHLREAHEAAAARVRDQRAAAERTQREQQLFADATRDVAPLRTATRVTHITLPVPPVARMHQRDEAAALQASLSDGIDANALLDSDDSLSWARAGLAPNTVRKLRRGDWVLQAQLDLHGMTREQARTALAAFLHGALRQGLRCVRVVHGKGLGSKNHAPVLKDKVRRWLMQQDAVLAYVQARAADGGAGALVVLLRNT